jgi:C4-type Zn-finger protein
MDEHSWLEKLEPGVMVEIFKQGLDDQIGERPCPICGETNWVTVPVPGYMVFHTHDFDIRLMGRVQLACFICARCYFLRSHVMDADWHSAIAEPAPKGAPAFQ